MYKVNGRNRIVYGSVIIVVISLGLGSRHYSGALPELLGDYAGDTLWAAMVFLGIGFLFKAWSTFKVAIIALSFSFLIEVSQLYHSPWIDSIRNTRLGSLVLGFGFLWSDLICYVLGIMIGIFIEKLIIGRTQK